MFIEHELTYEGRMSELMRSADAPLMKFFNERRVHTIHKGVVRK